MIRCLAVDDEMLSLELLEDNIRRIPFLHLVGRCGNAYEAMDIMLREPVDLIFLDIQMGGITGTQFLQSLSSMTSKPMVIFVTAYKKYALDGFELDVLDYLVKPVAFERFLKSVNKAAEYHALRNVAASPAAAIPAATDYFFVNVEYNLVKISISNIYFIEGLKDYIKIYQQGTDKPVITRLPMKSIAEKLPANRFIRIHKSYIVAVDKITSIRKNRIYIQQHIIPISDSYRDDLFRIIDPQKLI
ncbi:response regulator transcription factor [Pseudoflavitalea sp. X16]|uniref:LytR/AlgR family response regulator transcription factor n=1 Tax=Paraflavitalea devenefica TaxID=2716334 RepID=UPI00141E1B67|nr:LytTR family DNA-binding domain-containing protein [Paraflavitalea devenefica]NII28700.1 response regulator transcription factor [Paraflavitalea devenefica]